jgi:hypothetical protein
MSRARDLVVAFGALLAACATPSAVAPRRPEPSGERKPLTTSGEGGWNLALSSDAARPLATASPGPSAPVDAAVASPSGDPCAAVPSAVDHPLALALARDLGARFATYACVFHSVTDPDAAVPGFRVRALAAAAPFAARDGYFERRWAFVERYATELGLSAAPRQELVVALDEPGLELAKPLAGASRLLQRVPATWIETDGFIDLQLGAGTAPVLTSIDLAIIAHPERFAQGARVSRPVAQEVAMKAARADGAIPARITRQPALALRTTATGTSLVYEVTITRVVPTIGGLTEGPTWRARVDASTAKLASLRHD